MLMRAPRTRRISSSGSASRSAPAKVILPVVRACGGSNRIMARDVADFPDPDSPTSPNVPDSGMEKLTSRTAATSPVCVAKLTFRCATWRREDTRSSFDSVKEKSVMSLRLRADLVRRDPSFNTFMHRRNKRHLLFQQRRGCRRELAFHVQPAFGSKLLCQFQHLLSREIYVLAIIWMRHAHGRA